MVPSIYLNFILQIQFVSPYFNFVVLWEETDVGYCERRNYVSLWSSDEGMKIIWNVRLHILYIGNTTTCYIISTLPTQHTTFICT